MNHNETTGIINRDLLVIESTLPFLRVGVLLGFVVLWGLKEGMWEGHMVINQ